MDLFYCPDIAQTHELSEEESLHCVKVLRMREGEELLVVDGKGGKYYAQIATAHPKRCALHIHRVEQEPPRQEGRVHIAVAPTKSIDRMEWFVEKATEIGIDEITLLRCRYSERKEVNIDRLRKIAVSAMKQSQKATLPLLHPLTDVKRFVESCLSEQRAIAHCYKGSPRLLLKGYYLPAHDITVLIGPEGDFSEEEVAAAIGRGFQPVSLGESRLRTETAALVACHTICLLNQN